MAAAAILVLPQETALAMGGGKTGECLSGPKGTPPTGERWFYRVERGSQRHCWYTRRSAGSPRKLAEKPVEAPLAAKANEAAPQPLLPSVANARAEAEQWPPPQKAAPEGSRDQPKASEADNRIENRTWTLAERWSDGPEPAQAAAQLPVRLMKLQVVPAEPPLVKAQTFDRAEAPAMIEASVMQRFIDAFGGALAIIGVGTLLAALWRRRKHPDDDDLGLPPLAGPDGQPHATWYEPPMDRLRMARHLSELPQPAR